jgi:hypothetical protein
MITALTVIVVVVMVIVVLLEDHWRWCEEAFFITDLLYENKFNNKIAEAFCFR